MEAKDIQKKIVKKLYHAYHNGGWKSVGVEVKKVQFSEKNKDEAKVLVYIIYQRPHTKKQKIVNLSDQWKKVDGKWFHVFRDPIIQLR